MNTFLKVLNKHDISYEKTLRRGALTTLQVNMGNVCNQSCEHCHIGASPRGKNIMSKKIVEDIVAFLGTDHIKTLDITGGAPEMNPHFEYFLLKTRTLVDEIIVRSNLTVLFEEGKEHFPDLYKRLKIHLICSLPCYLKENVDAQRGTGVFEKSIRALRRLNEIGYTRHDDLAMDLVYNPQGANLPPQQETLEKEYKRMLRTNYGINFNRLITITNVPIKRFKKYLESRGEYEHYYNLLQDNFNPQVVGNLMCRTFLSVGYDGKVYDCDFNQALGLSLKDTKGKDVTIYTLNPYKLEGQPIQIDRHCLSCTAGSGSSCQGALNTQTDTTDKKDFVKTYYGKILHTKKDLKTSACCSTESMPETHKNIVRNIETEVIEKFYGCGSPIPPELEGCTVLDLGSGTGRDVYMASYLVGEAGMVIGVDMTDEQLDVALRAITPQMKRFGFTRSNVAFKKGFIEDLREIGIQDNSIDVVISNCVINLSPDKKAVFGEIFRVLKQGGELYFADVFAGQRVPEHIKNDPIFYGECLGGSLYIEDFRRMMAAVGCPDVRIVTSRKIKLNNPEMEAKAGMIDFYSMTVRAFKLESLEDRCEDYGQVTIYKGTIPDEPHTYVFDDHHTFITNKPMLVCGNTAAMLEETRYSKHFTITGDRRTHYGLFECAPLSVKKEINEQPGGACC